MNRECCFVLMPSGRQRMGAGFAVDFGSVYRDLVAPALRATRLDSIRGNERTGGQLFHTTTFEQLLLCEYAVVDLTIANASVFSQLGVRHALRPGTTILIFAHGSQLPFDAGALGAISYDVAGDGSLKDMRRVKTALMAQLKKAKGGKRGLSLFYFLENYTDIAHTKTDVFREKVDYSTARKSQLAKARKIGVAAVRAVEKKIGNIQECESAVVIDLLLSYRAVQAWVEMINLVKKMPRPLASTVLVQEQLAFALNRRDKGKQAEGVLKSIVKKSGPSSETYSILGRVYKDRWEAALRRKNKTLANDLSKRAINAYLRGFQADWRDALPGINAVTLMELKEPPDPRRKQLTPIVAYAVERRIATGKPDYWDYATLVELAVLAKDREKAASALKDSLASIREAWEPETTARNLRLIREARERRNDKVPWANEIETQLRHHSKI
jgi:hypothetical protein